MSHFTEALYLRKQLQQLINEQNLLLKKINLINLYEAPPVPSKASTLVPDVNAQTLPPNFVYNGPIISTTPIDTAQQWIETVFTSIFNMDQICQQQSMCMFSNPILQQEFLDALRAWTLAQNINMEQMLTAMAQWSEYTALLAELNAMPPLEAQNRILNDPSVFNMLARMGDPSVSNNILQYITHMEAFIELLENYHMDMVTTPTPWSDEFNEFLEAWRNNSGISPLDIEDSIIDLKEYLNKFSDILSLNNPTGSVHGASLARFNMISGAFLDDLFRQAAGSSINVTDIFRYIRALATGDMATQQEILDNSPYREVLIRLFREANAQQIAQLNGQIDRITNQRDLLLALATVLGLSAIALFFMLFGQSGSGSGTGSGTGSGGGFGGGGGGVP